MIVTILAQLRIRLKGTGRIRLFLNQAPLVALNDEFTLTRIPRADTPGGALAMSRQRDY